MCQNKRLHLVDETAIKNLLLIIGFKKPITLARYFSLGNNSLSLSTLLSAQQKNHCSRFRYANTMPERLPQDNALHNETRRRLNTDITFRVMH